MIRNRRDVAKIDYGPIANRRIQSYFLQKPGMSRTMIV